MKTDEKLEKMFLETGRLNIEIERLNGVLNDLRARCEDVDDENRRVHKIIKRAIEELKGGLV